MTYTPKNIRKTLKKCITEVSLNPESFVKIPGKDFTLERKLSFEQVLKFVLSMTGKALRGELMEYFGLKTSMPTVSAFVQQRNKIDYRAFEFLFHAFTTAIEEKFLFKGYKINFAAAAHICRNFFLKNISPSDVEALLLMHLLPVRQRSAYLRRGSPRAAPSFTYRIP